MPLPLLPIALGGAALLALTRKESPAPTQGGLATGSAAKGPSEGVAIAPTSEDGKDIGKTAGALAGAAAVAIAVGTVGAEVDRLINPNSTLGSQIVAGVAVGGAAGLAVLAAVGVLGITFPIVGIFLAVAVAIYAIVVVVQDLVRLQYGQAGGRKDFAKQFGEVFASAKRAIQANPANKLDETALIRQLQPFTEGFMGRLNWSAYQKVMLKKNVVVSGAKADAGPSTQMGVPVIAMDANAVFPGTDVKVTEALLWHLNWYIDRGYVVGASGSARPIAPAPEFDALFIPNSNFPISKSNEFVAAYCPVSEQIRTKVATTEQGAAFVAGFTQLAASNPFVQGATPLATEAGSLQLNVQTLAQAALRRTAGF